MNIFQKHRFSIYNLNQHPYRHSIKDFSYVNPALPAEYNDLESAMDWLFNVIYPNNQDSVANPAALPMVGNNINDYRVVNDDGDGKAAGYRWEQREGDASPKWYKIYDMDWGEQSVLSNFLNHTIDMYVYKAGIGDRDENGDLFTGILAGQRIYGGDQPNTHLTLYANSGDGVGANTGYVQIGDNFRPIADNTFDIGTATERLKDGYFSNSLIVGDLTLSSGSILSSSGAVSFGDENLTTTGFLNVNLLETQSQIVMKEIATPATPAATYNSLYFKSDDKLYRLDELGNEKLVGLEFTSSNDNRLVRTDGTTGSAIQESGIVVTDADAMSGITSLLVDNLLLDGNSISSNDVNGNINLTPNGTGRVILNNARVLNLKSDRLIRADGNKDLLASGVEINSSDELLGASRLTVDNLQLDSNTISSTDTNGNILLVPNGTGKIQVNSLIDPANDNSQDLGSSLLRFANLFLSNSINDGTESFLVSELMDLRSINYRDVARTQPAQSGDAIFYNGSQWLASAPDSEISHSNLSDLGNDDHAQYLLLAGRTAGQSIIGGTDAGDDLTLESTANATKGSIFTKDNLSPFTDASFSGGWNGADLGDNTHNYRNLYMKGEAFGLRVQNVTTGTIPSSSANNVGRLVFNSDTNQILVDTGTAFRVAGVSKHVEDLTFNGTDLTKDVDVSANIVDARNAIIQLKDNANDYENIYCELRATSASNVRIVTSIALAAGTYRLVVME